MSDFSSESCSSRSCVGTWIMVLALGVVACVLAIAWLFFQGSGASLTTEAPNQIQALQDRVDQLTVKLETLESRTGVVSSAPASGAGDVQAPPSGTESPMPLLPGVSESSSGDQLVPSGSFEPGHSGTDDRNRGME